MAIPYFKFDVMDWLTSPSVMGMDPAERGAYIHLLALCWADVDCGLPDDDEKLARLAGFAGARSAPMATIRQHFTRHPRVQDKLYNQRLFRDWIKMKDISEKSTESAAKRWPGRTKLPPGTVKPAKPRKGAGKDAHVSPTAQPETFYSGSVEAWAKLIEAHPSCVTKGSPERRAALAQRFETDDKERVAAGIRWILETNGDVAEGLRAKLAAFPNGVLVGPNGQDKIGQALAAMGYAAPREAPKPVEIATDWGKGTEKQVVVPEGR